MYTPPYPPQESSKENTILKCGIEIAGLVCLNFVYIVEW